MVFYHITPTGRVSKILREGLKVRSTRTLGHIGQSRRYGIYLAEDLDTLIKDIFSWRTLKVESKAKNFTVLKVRVPKGHPIGEDPEFTEDFLGMGYWVVFKDIPGKNIEVFKHLKMDTWGSLVNV